MSYDEHLRDQKKKSKGSAGRTPVASRLASFGGGVKPTTRADWGDVHPELLSRVIMACTRLGGAISFGTSRDAGVFNLTLFLDGDRRTIWLQPSDNVEEEVAEIAKALEDMNV